MIGNNQENDQTHQRGNETHFLYTINYFIFPEEIDTSFIDKSNVRMKIFF